MSWPIVPKIKDGVTTFDEASINPIIQALEARTDSLKRSVVSTDEVEGITFTDIGLKGCIKGQFVAYDAKTNKYVPAHEALETNSIHRPLFPADASYVIGLLITDVLEDQGTILMSGVVKSSGLLNLILKDGKRIPGNYYLTSNGQVTVSKDQVSLPIKCGTLSASGCFSVSIQIPDFRTHDHIKYILSPSLWKEAEDSVYTHMYDTSADPTVLYALNTLSTATCLIVNNRILMSGEYKIENNSILITTTDPEIKAELFLVNPFIGVTQWLSDVTAAPGNELIKITQVGKHAIVDVSDNVTEVRGDGKAVVGVTRNGVKVANIVNTIVAGDGINVNTDKGVVTISSADSLNSLLDFNLLNANGVVFGGNEEFLLKFPQGCVSSVLGQVRIPPHVKDNTTAKLVIYVKGTGTPSGAGEVTITRFDLNEEESAIIRGSATINDVSLTNSDNMYKLTSSDIQVKGNDLLNISIKYTNPSVSLHAYYIGLQIGG